MEHRTSSCRPDVFDCLESVAYIIGGKTVLCNVCSLFAKRRRQTYRSPSLDDSTKLKIKMGYLLENALANSVGRWKVGDDFAALGEGNQHSLPFASAVTWSRFDT